MLPIPTDQTDPSLVTQPSDPNRAEALLLHTMTLRKHKSELLTHEPDFYDGIEPDERDVFPRDLINPHLTPNATPEERQAETDRLLSLISIHGSPDLKAGIRQVCTEYIDIFSESVRATPADIKPMHIPVDTTKWHVKGNAGPPRPQPPAREAAIEEQVNEYKRLGAIKPCNTPYYSQLVMAPKPDGKWRMCIDYRRLNDATEVTQWTIPNIKMLIARLAGRNARYKAVCDLTSGFHQAPLAQDSMLFTAFICFMGIFCWTRVAMGLRGAPPYFQQAMATILVGLLYKICELYLDDILIHGKDKPTFLQNLREVFERLRKHNITLNPKKCRMGLEEIEYVGHKITPNGWTFTEEKKQGVMDIPKPTLHKHLKSWIGLVQHFRSHVPNTSVKIRPLQAMLENYNRSRVLQWTPEAEASFHDIKYEIANCPLLYFLDSTGQIFVQTDASDYGIGAYVFQRCSLPEGGTEDRPIALISKALSGPQISWSTPEKEAYAIFYTLTTLSYLLRDVSFTIQTDHKNLTFLNMDGSSKVKRWKMEIQEYDFHVEHIGGVDNHIADTLSRLCYIGEEEVSAYRNAVEYDSEVIPQKQRDIITTCHNSQVGHGGLERTLNKLHEAQHNWDGMRRQTRQFIKQCPVCQNLNPIKISIKCHPFTTAAYEPMACINIDTIGPLPEDADGNKHILVIIDCFTRFLELYPQRSTESTEAATQIINHAGRYGFPDTIRSDQGTQFVNERIENLKSILGSQSDLTIAYSKEVL